MSSSLTDDEKERIERFCETPPHDRSPEDLLPGRKYTDDVEVPRNDTDADRSLFTTVWNRLRSR